MQCFCKDQSYSLKIEADFVPDPIWCNNCDCNIDIEKLNLSDKLRNELYEWAMEFGLWRDESTGRPIEGAYELVKQYNNHGREITEKVKKELGDKYTVSYISAV